MFDLIIIGLGPAGLTASIYAKRYGLSVIVVGKTLGGTLSLAPRVENWPGIATISGADLMKKTEEQVKRLGGEIVYDLVTNIKIQMTNDKSNSNDKIQNNNTNNFIITLTNGKQYESKAIIAALGNERRRLNIPGEDQFLGKGVSYCATCDGFFFHGKTVAIIGGGDSATVTAIHMAGIAQQVYLIYRGDKLKAESFWIEQLQALSNVTIIYSNNLIKISGQNTVTSVELEQEHNGSRELVLDGIFIEIGGVPATALLQPLGVEFNEQGYVKVDEEMKTNVPGIFCAGDFTSASMKMKQAITAAAQGAAAASSAFTFIKGQVAPRILGT